MMTAIALDDEQPSLAILENFCQRSGLVHLIKTFTQPSEAIKYLRQFPIDLLFLDIQMPSISGLDFYKQLDRDIPVIFTTAFSEYAVEGFNLQAMDYLLKPFTYDRFFKAITRANELFQIQNQKEQSNHIILRADYSLVKVELRKIILIEGMDDYLKIHIEAQKPVIVRMTMKNILERLPKADFIRVHRSFIVPLYRITNVRNKMIQLGDKEIPIGSSYEAAFYTMFKS